MYFSRLKALRKAKGITLEKLSELSNISIRIFVSFGKWYKEKPFN
jgi:transcriptional regulator with XRE-family HTH domain